MISTPLTVKEEVCLFYYDHSSGHNRKDSGYEGASPVAQLVRTYLLMQEMHKEMWV